MLNHNEYLNYTLPTNWCAEESMANLLIYNHSGSGAITISFFNTLITKDSLDEQISILLGAMVGIVMTRRKDR